jgi:hypothetical protein
MAERKHKWKKGLQILLSEEFEIIYVAIFPQVEGKPNLSLIKCGLGTVWEDSMGGESNFPVEKPENISHMIKINNNNSKSSQA